MLELIECLLAGAGIVLCAFIAVIPLYFSLRRILATVVGYALGIPVFVASILIIGLKQLGRLLSRK